MKNENREKIYHSWHNMKQRCLDPKNPDYKHYGGRGITVCSRWLDFQIFYDDMAMTWFPGAPSTESITTGIMNPKIVDGFRELKIRKNLMMSAWLKEIIIFKILNIEKLIQQK